MLMFHHSALEFSCIGTIGQRRGGETCQESTNSENGYTKWAFKIPKKSGKVEVPSKPMAATRKFPVSIPHISGVSSPKDKIQKEKQCGVVYSVICVGCEEYIGESARTQG